MSEENAFSVFAREQRIPYHNGYLSQPLSLSYSTHQQKVLPK
jgi:hypothetical protein